MADEYELGTVGPIPTVNPNVAKIADMLKIAKKYADQYYVKENVPLIGGTTLGEFLLGKAPEEIERWGQGDYPVRNPNEVVRTGGNRADIFKAGRFEPTFDVATNVIAPLAGAAKVTKGMPIGNQIIYHGTSPESAKSIAKRGFDIEQSADGSIWFTTNPKIGEVAATGKGAIVEKYLKEDRLKLATPEQADKYFTDQLIAEGYVGVKYPGYGPDKATHYQIFEPQVLDIKGFKDEGNYRRVGEPQSNLEKFGITGNDEGRLSGGLIENAGRITRRSNPDDIKAQTELIQANLNNPEFNKALTLAKKHNPEFDFQVIKDMPESSLIKQHGIAKTFDLLTKESVPPQLKQAIFDDYMVKHPEMMKKEGIKDYDDLVTKSYGQLRKEIDQQFDDMVKGGMKLSYHQGDANYLDSREMLRDALVNQHLYTYRGGDVHPLLNDLDPYYGLNSNEKFRAVHDYFGHGTTGATFGRKGEELAYGAHSHTLSPLARIAAAAETRGQNSFVNYSGINADLEQKMMTTRIARDQAIHRGESPDQYDAILRDLGGQWQYAKQQGVALPPEMLEIGYKGNIPEYVKANLYPEHGISHKGYHYSNKTDLEETDPTKYGYGIRGAEAKRLALPGSIKERTYFYNEPGMREPGLGRNQYEADLEHFYDTENDPAGIIRMADNFNRDKNGILDTAGRANDIERMMREAGYHGYFNQNTGIGISFEPQKVREYSRE
jgi:hypothetical protein